LPLRIRHLRLLPSFPTRRSSDLDADAKRVDITLCLAFGCDAQFIEITFTRLPEVRIHHLQSPASALSSCNHLLIRITQFNADITDRKSTRLSSSHVSISYAVFCL